MIELGNSKITYLGKAPDGRNRYAADCHISAVQMREAGKEWEDIDPTFEELDSDGSTINFTKTPMLVKVGEDSKRRIYPDKTDLSYWIELQKPFASMGKPTRKDGWFYWDFTHAIMGVRVTKTAVKFGFRLKDNQAPTSITIPFLTQGLTREGRFLYHDGKVVAELRKPVATGSNFDTEGLLARKNCNIVFGTGQITVDLDPTGLEFPIEIDPTLEVSIDATLDDNRARRYEITGFWNDDAYVVAGNNTATNKGWSSSARFIGVNIPAGATVGVAYLVLICNYARSTTVVRSDLCCENSNNPVRIINYADFVGRLRTTGAYCIAWDGIGAWTVGNPYQSLDFAVAVQKVVDDNAGTGDALIVFWEDKDMESDVGAIRNAASYDDLDYDPPMLHLEWSAEETKTKTYTLEANLSKAQTKVYTLGARLADWGYGSEESFRTSTLKTYTLAAKLINIETESYTLAARLFKEYSKTYTLGARLQKTDTETYTLAAKLIAAVAGEKTYTISARLIQTLPKTYTLVAKLFRLQSKTYTLSARLIQTTSQTYTISARLLQQQTKTFTISARLLKYQEQTYTLAAKLVEVVTGEKTYTLTARLFLTGTKTHTLTAKLFRSQTQTYTLGVRLFKTLAKTYTLAAKLIEIIAGQKTYTLEARLYKTQIKIYTLTAGLVLLKTKTYSLEARLFKAQVETYTLSVKLFKQLTKTYTLAARLIQLQLETYTIGARLLQAQEKTYTLTAKLIQIVAGQKTYTLSGRLFKLQTQTFTLVAKLVQRETKSYVLEARVFKQQLQIYTIGSRLFQISTKPYTIEARIYQAQIKDYTLAARLIETITKSYTLSAKLSYIALTKTFTLSASLYYIQTKTYTLGALLLKTSTTTYTITARIMPAVIPTYLKYYTLTAYLRVLPPPIATSLRLESNETSLYFERNETSLLFEPNETDLFL